MDFGFEKEGKLPKKISGEGNMGHGLGEFLQQNGLVQSMKPSESGERKMASPSMEKLAINTAGASIGENTLSKANGILTVEGLHQVSGWTKSFKGTLMKEVAKNLERFHEALNGEINASDISAVKQANLMFNQLMKSVQNFLTNGAQLHKKEEAALKPVMSSLLIQLYSLGNVFDHQENLAYDYLLQGNLSSARVGDILTSRGSKSVQGNMANTAIDSVQTDKTAQQMRKENSENSSQGDYLQELKSRRLPSFGDKNATQSLEQIAKMLDDIELQSKGSMEREDLRTEFFDVTKMIHLLLSNPRLLSKEGMETIKSGKMTHEKTDLLNTAEFFQAVSGMTVQEAIMKLDEMRQAKAEIAAQDSESKGGERSQVLIDKKKNRVLRSSKESGGIKEQKARNNYNYDEAMSRLGEITGLGGQAGARTTYYKDKNGQMQYGSNMDRAKGMSATKAKLSFGDAKADSQMKAGRHNIFGTGSPEEINKNAALIVSSFKLQIIDYLSQHQDRHTENYFIDLEAENPEQAFMGIDNDNVFGLGTSAERQKRTVSYKQHAQDSYYKDYKGLKDVVSVLKGFQYIPKETAAQIRNLDEKKIEQEMRPYLDRGARFALIGRVKKLKQFVENEAQVFDIHTEDGMKEFKKQSMGLLVQSMMGQRGGGINILGMTGTGGITFARAMPGILLRTLAMQYFGFGSMFENEYNTGNVENKEYYDKSNIEYKKIREEKFWNSFQGAAQAAGLLETPEFKELEEKYKKGELKMF